MRAGQAGGMQEDARTARLQPIEEREGGCGGCSRASWDNRREGGR